MAIKNPFTGEEIRGNPWTKKGFNLTHQATIDQTDPALAKRLREEAPRMDEEEHRKTHTRNLAEFNELDQTAKIAFIRNGGEVV
jgi:hypothetical protein